MNDPTTEAFLKRFDCDFTFDEALPLIAIDRIASVTNQSRFEPIDPDTVDRYTAALEEGAEFPPVLVRLIDRPHGPQRILLGGNHRERAHTNAGRKTIAAYLVACDETVALEIAYADNATHGLPPTKAEQLAHALLLVEQHGRPMTHAAKIVGLHPQQITKHVALQGVIARAGRLGVAVELAEVPAGTQPRFASLRDDRVFVKVARAIAANNIGSNVANKMIGDINAQTDVASALDILQAHVREHRANKYTGRTVGAPSTNPAIMLRTALGTIKGLNAADIVDRCTSPRDLEDLHERLVAAGRHLMAIDTLAQAKRRPVRSVG